MPSATDTEAAKAYYNSIRQPLVMNRPLNEFVADRVTGTGSNLANGPADLHTVLVHEPRFIPKNFASDFSQLFTGVRILLAERLATNGFNLRAVAHDHGREGPSTCTCRRRSWQASERCSHRRVWSDGGACQRWT